MGRLGDLIRTERLRQKLTLKQVAKKTGVSESYLAAVEAGTRIIQDDQARRILRTIGLKNQNEAEFTLDDIAATVDLTQVRPKVITNKKAPEPEAEQVASIGIASGGENEKGVAGSVWLDALSSVLKPVPVLNAVLKQVGHKLMPIEGGRIEGSAPDKVFWFLVPDDSMRGFRIHRDDAVFIVPAQSPVDDAVMLVEYGVHRALRKVKKLDAFTVMLQSFDREYASETLPVSQVLFVGRAVRVEFSLS